MKHIDRFAYLLWPLWCFGLAALWSFLRDSSVAITDDWWDTEHYAAIAEEGYAQFFRSAFFPAFPYLWGFLGVPAWVMGGINLILWFASAVWLDRVCKIRRRALVVASVIPSVIFFAIPYSESMFFLTVTVTATGLVRQDTRLTALGVFLSALVRPTAIILLPALYAARWLSGERFGSVLKKSVFEGLAGLVAVLAVFYLQSLQTGNFFGFFEAQTLWGNGFGWPRLPFRSWGGDITTLFDAVALFIGIFAGRTLWHTRRGGVSKLTPVERFGLAGIFFTALLILFTRGGEVFSLNRFIFATAFFPIAISAWSNTVFHKRELPLLLVAWLFFSVLFKSYVHIAILSYYIGAGVLIFLTLNGLQNRRMRWLSLSLLLVASSAMIVFFYFTGKWIG